MRNAPERPFRIDVESLETEFAGKIWSWRGPAPYQIGATEWETSLFPKDDGYLVPIKDAARKAEGLAEGDTATVQLAIRS